MAGGVGVLVGQPFDMLKVRMQIANLQNASSSAALAESLQGAGAADHGGMRHVLRRLRFLYRGSLPPLMTAGLVQSLNFSGFEAVKRTMHPDPLTPAPLPVFWAAGCGGTLLVTLITCPSQRIKIQQQSASKGIGMLRCVSQIVNTQGLAGLYKGYMIHVLLEGVGRGWYMMTYETMKRRLFPQFAEGGRDKSQIPLHKRMMAGACAGMVGWTSIYPLDVVRSRIMAQRQPVYSGALDCAVKTYREGGLPVFFRGIQFSLVRAAPVAACVLPTYDLFYTLFADLTLRPGP
eukprot:Tamp_22899.p1 GENE.Tamp_22899~~Tamp_22899.p1  ORF type:complete len:323 (-),score=61.65 Tamp_22899:93-962(-)